MLSAGYGFYEKLNGSVNLNHRAGKLNLFGDVSGQRNREWQDLLADYTLTNQGLTTNNLGDLIGIRTTPLINARLGFDYSLSKRTTAGGLVAGFLNNPTRSLDVRITSSGVMSCGNRPASIIRKGTAGNMEWPI